MQRTLFLAAIPISLALSARADEPFWKELPGADAKAVEAPPSEEGKLRIVVFGAHPDDAEIRAGGCGALWAAAGHAVQFVSVTNGDVGHFRMCGPALAARRFVEVSAADKLLGVSAKVLEIGDGKLMPSYENREIFIRLIRQWRADVVIAHRPNDYHPDHRYTGVLVQDAAYMVTVPFICPETPYLRDNPLFLYSLDHFERPAPFRPDIVVSIDAVIEKKLDALLAMESQFVEGGANGYRQGMPTTDAEWAARRKNARDGFRRRFAQTADRFREQLLAVYGAESGKQVRYAEAFEICEYGRRPAKGELRKYFPFLPEAR